MHDDFPHEVSNGRPQRTRARSTNAGSNNIGKRFLQTAKIKRGGNKQNDRGAGGNPNDGPRRRLGVEQRPTEAFDHTDHGIERVNGFPALRQKTAGISDRRDKQPRLHEERHRVAHVAKVDIDGREPDADAHRGNEREQHKGRQPNDLRARKDAVVKHHAQQHDETRQEIGQAGKYCGDGNGHAREVDLVDQIGVAHHAVGGLGDAMSEKRPGQQRGEGEDRIGHAVRRHFGQTAEEQTKDQHGKKWL